MGPAGWQRIDERVAHGAFDRRNHLFGGGPLRLHRGAYPGDGGLKNCQGSSSLTDSVRDVDQRPFQIVWWEEASLKGGRGERRRGEDRVHV